MPTCFISYSWDRAEHKDWVRMLASRLAGNGIYVHLDQWDVAPGSDLLLYMERSVLDAEFVLLVCTPTFARKADAGVGGVGYEKSIVSGELFHGTNRPNKFVPLLREGEPSTALPAYLRSKVYVDLRDDRAFDRSFEELLRHLLSKPRHRRPTVGAPPDLDTAPATSARVAARVAGAGAWPFAPVQLDSRPLLGRSGRPWSEPYVPDQPVYDFLGRVYLGIAADVPPYTYGERWVLCDTETATRLDQLGPGWARERGHEEDERPIQDAGIRPGQQLRIVRP